MVLSVKGLMPLILISAFLLLNISFTQGVYLEGPCTTIYKGDYFLLQIPTGTYQDTFDQDSVTVYNSATNMIIQQGCTLKLYKEPFFKGECLDLTPESVVNPHTRKRTIRSGICCCSKSAYNGLGSTMTEKALEDSMLMEKKSIAVPKNRASISTTDTTWNASGTPLAVLIVAYIFIALSACGILIALRILYRRSRRGQIYSTHESLTKLM